MKNQEALGQTENFSIKQKNNCYFTLFDTFLGLIFRPGEACPANEEEEDAGERACACLFATVCGDDGGAEDGTEEDGRVEDERDEDGRDEDGKANASLISRGKDETNSGLRTGIGREFLGCSGCSASSFIGAGRIVLGTEEG